MRSLYKNKLIVFIKTIPLSFLLMGLSVAFCHGEEAPKDMVLINPGGFTRGLEADSPIIKNSGLAFKDEGPATMIYLSAYYIDKYEVSNAKYTEFIKATDYSAPAYWDHHLLNKPNYPVTGVNWYDANAYCHWANKRLPTEAEWEKAARGPAGNIFPWGNKFNYQMGNFAKGKSGQKNITSPVDSYPKGKSYYGVYNMAGNVFEWVQDWYASDYYKTSKDVRNPQGPKYVVSFSKGSLKRTAKPAGKKKVIRGGSWFAPAQSVTTTHRFWNDPMNNSYGVGLGFRCAKNHKPDSSMQARSFYMEALIKLGEEKYKEAKEAIQNAIQKDPENKEYRNILNSIDRKM
jgi:formylglycine-generating enzyme required for sulfatase activity